MHPVPLSLSNLLRSAFALGLLAATSLPTHAQDWNGAGADDNFSTDANWTGGIAPVNDGSADATLGGFTRKTPVLDTHYHLDTLNLATSGFTLDGSNTLTIGSAIDRNLAGYVAFTANVPVVLAGDVTLGGTATSGFVKLNGIVSGGHGLAWTPLNDISTLTLAANNSFTGSLTIGAGSVFLGGNASTAAGSLAGNVVHDGSGSFTVKRSGNVTWDRVISGTTTGEGLSIVGGIAEADQLTFTVAVPQTYTGSTNVGRGTMVLGLAHALPTGTNLSISSFGTLETNYDVTVGNLIGGTGGELVVGSGAVFTSNLSADSNFGGTSGAGSVVITGAHDLQLFDHWEHTGGTTVTDARLLVGNGSYTVSLAGDVTNNGEVVFNNPVNQTFAGDMSGTGVLTKLLGTTLTLTGAISHTGGIVIDDGTLRLGQTSPFTYTGDISGGGALGIRNEAGVGTAITFTGNVTTDIALDGSGAAVIFDHDTDVTYSGNLSAGGAFTKAGSGTLTFNAAHDHSGLVAVNEGTLIAAAENALGSHGVNIANGAALRIDHHQNLSRLIAEAGSSLQLTNNAAVTIGFSALVDTSLDGTGNITFDGGNSAFSAGGTLDGQMTLEGGETSLAGTFTNLDVVTAATAKLSAGGWTLSGSSAGASTIDNLTLNAGSVLQIDIFSPDGIAGIGWDKLTALGTLALGGTSGTPITINLRSVSETGSGVFLDNFDHTQNYSWNVLSGQSAVTGFDADAFDIVVSQFFNSYDPDYVGDFSLSQVGNDIFLNFSSNISAVPEPSTYAALMGIFALGFTSRRRRRRSV